jgi:DNA modification methylase
VSKKPRALQLDVFAGSGTTGVVALDLGRRFVGYEINGGFCRLCEQRLGSLNDVENNL